jgi:hypothetical protein
VPPESTRMVAGRGSEPAGGRAGGASWGPRDGAQQG